MKMWKKSEIKDYRMKLHLGLQIIPMLPSNTGNDRRMARIGAIYALGKILGMEDAK